jgi:hypothetical protein
MVSVALASLDNALEKLAGGTSGWREDDNLR